MRAEAIFTGTELLLGQIVNTNAALLGQKLAAAGIDLYHQVTVGDNLERIAAAIKTARERADLIIVCGGLGPTEDDLSREALAIALGLPLEEDPEARTSIEAFFRSRRRPLLPANLKQALIPKGGRSLPNPYGTAPGVFLCHDGKYYALLPGPPHEFRPMLEEKLLPLLEALGAGQQVILSRVIKITGLGESAVEEMVRDLLHRDNPTLAPLARPSEVSLRITAKAPSPAAAQELISTLEKELFNRLGNHIFGTDEETLEGVVAGLLTGQGLTLAVAESCSGGLLAHRLTNIPGSSSFFLAGITAYANEAKEKLLGVEAGLLKKFGAVSEEVAVAMARGVRLATGSDIGVGITGIAGPAGGTPAKPVGLVYLAVDFRGKLTTRQEILNGEREIIKYRATQSALDMLWRALTGRKA
ncbi:MAG: nicotinamide-nucleotide amidase [Clostridia bacterium]|nr:nicotinamide-nucleotide amidase [Clostridia bacterium]